MTEQAANAVSQAASIVASKSRSTSWADPGKSDVLDRASKGAGPAGLAFGFGREPFAREVELMELSREWLVSGVDGVWPLAERMDVVDGEGDANGFRSADFRAPELPGTTVDVLDDELALLPD